MSITINEFVDANISISPTGVGLGTFGILGFATNEIHISPIERSQKFGSLAEVADVFGTNSETYRAATAFYSQTPQPKDFVAITVYETAQAPAVYGGASESVGNISGLTTATLTITVGGTAYTTAAITLTGVGSHADIVTVAQAEITTAGIPATLSHNGKQYVLTSDLGQPNMEFVDDLLGASLGLNQALAKKHDAVNSETIVEALSATAQASLDITALVLHKKYRDLTTLAVGNNTTDVADWCEANKVIFCNTTNNLASLSNAITSDIGSVLLGKSLRYSITMIAKNPNQYPSASVFGRAASVNFEGINSTITLNLKAAPTISAEDFTAAEFATLKEKRINAVVRIGKSTTAYTDSRMANGSWMDSVHGLLWLENRVEVDMFNYLYVQNTKVPYTQDGLNALASVLTRSLRQAKINGLVAAGYLPDGTFLPEGYKVEALDLAQVSTSDKTNRIYRGLKFTAIGAGAIHKVLIDGSFSE